MSETIAVTGNWIPSELKRELLFFDKIVVTDPHSIQHAQRYLLAAFGRGYSASMDQSLSLIDQEMANFEFLMEKGCLVDSSEVGFDYSANAALETIAKVDQNSAELYREIRDEIGATVTLEDLPNAVWKQFKSRQVFADALTLFVADKLRKSGASAVALSRFFDEKDAKLSIEQKTARRVSVSRVVLGKIPVPTADVSFEKILDFRADEEARAYLTGLRHWMNKASKLDKEDVELSEEIDWLKYKHSERLHKHKIETQESMVSSIFVGGAEFAENILKFRWGDAAKGLVSITRNRTKPLIFDIDEDAGELNFLIRADNQFK